MINFHTKYGGIIKLNVERADGSLKYGNGLNVEFSNIVTDAGLDALASVSASGLTSYCALGSGNSTPAAGQTALDSQVGTRIGPAVSQTFGYVSGAAPYNWMKRTYAAATGQIVGNLSEIGFFSASSGGTMFSRALIKDGGGNPTTITLLAAERLTVYYELRRYPPTTDLTGVININGADHTWVSRACNIDEYDGVWDARKDATGASLGYKTNSVLSTQTLGSVTGFPGGTSYKISDTSYSAYTNGTFYRDFTVTASPSQGNAPGGIGSAALLSLGSQAQPSYALYQVSFDPVIPKTNLQTLTINGRVSWGRL